MDIFEKAKQREIIQQAAKIYRCLLWSIILELAYRYFFDHPLEDIPKEMQNLDRASLRKAISFVTLCDVLILTVVAIYAITRNIYDPKNPQATMQRLAQAQQTIFLIFLTGLTLSYFGFGNFGSFGFGDLETTIIQSYALTQFTDTFSLLLMVPAFGGGLILYQQVKKHRSNKP